MKTAILIREKKTDEGTFGYFTLDGFFWHSLELPDRNNQPNISCIPSGEYICKIRYSPSFKKELYCLQNVKNRSYILIHGANFAGDTSKGYQSHLNGCIALGKSKGVANNKYGKKQSCIFSSQQAIKEFMQITNKEDFKLTIEELQNVDISSK